LEGPFLPCHIPDKNPHHLSIPVEFIGYYRINRVLEGIEVNDVQRTAIVRALYNPISIIQGPPGTGKTTTASELISAWLNLHKEWDWRGFPQNIRRVLAVAQSNIAVDQLFEALLKRGVKAVRVGPQKKIRADLLKYSFESVLQNDYRIKEVKQKQVLVDKYADEVQQLKPGTEEYRYHTKNLSRMYNAIEEEYESISLQVIRSFDVVLTTCIGSGVDNIEYNRYGMVLVDEAAQATEPEVLVAVKKATSRIVLIGDHHQLPPTILSSGKLAEPLRVSLFERAVRSGIITATMLRYQYRMHPFIAEWPNQRFYNGLLLNGVDQDTRAINRKFWWPNVGLGSSQSNHDRCDDDDNHNRLLGSSSSSSNSSQSSSFPVVFIEVSTGEDAIDLDTKSRHNMHEARVVVECLRRLLKSGVEPASLGVISPYSSQISKLKQLVEQDVEIKSIESKFNFSVEIKTVDGYQGREKDLIIMSTVVANERGSVGFLKDWRRVNVV